MLANSFDASGSSGRPIAADQQSVGAVQHHAGDLDGHRTSRADTAHFRPSPVTWKLTTRPDGVARETRDVRNIVSLARSPFAGRGRVLFPDGQVKRACCAECVGYL